MLITYIMEECRAITNPDYYNPEWLGPCKVDCKVCGASACPYGDPEHFARDGCDTCHSRCPVVMGQEYDASWEGPCHTGCRACSIYACPWGYEFHFDDGSCGQCDYMAQFSDVEYVSDSERLEIIKTRYSTQGISGDPSA
jgi:hypothetical protein